VDELLDQLLAAFLVVTTPATIVTAPTAAATVTAATASTATTATRATALRLLGLLLLRGSGLDRRLDGFGLVGLLVLVLHS
jgi:hypothetical protein